MEILRRVLFFQNAFKALYSVRPMGKTSKAGTFLSPRDSMVKNENKLKYILRSFLLPPT